MDESEEDHLWQNILPYVQFPTTYGRTYSPTYNFPPAGNLPPVQNELAKDPKDRVSGWRWRRTTYWLKKRGGPPSRREKLGAWSEMARSSYKKHYFLIAPSATQVDGESKNAGRQGRKAPSLRTARTPSPSSKRAELTTSMSSALDSMVMLQDYRDAFRVHN